MDRWDGCEVWVDGWAEGEGKDGFSSLVKQNKKGKKCAVFCFAGKRKILFYILRCDRERVLFIGTQFSILYTSMYSPAEAATQDYMGKIS